MQTYKANENRNTVKELKAYLITDKFVVLSFNVN